MSYLRSRVSACWLLALFTAVVAPSVVAAGPKENVLIDFKDTRKDPDGTIFRPYEYVYDTWKDHVTDLRGRGVLIKAPSGKGGMGENKTGVSFAGCTALDLAFAISGGNRAGALSFSLEDKDGTEEVWTIPLTGTPVGQEVHARLALDKSSTQAKPGKTPGLNLKKIATWQVRGDYTDAHVEVLLIKLTQAQ